MYAVKDYVHYVRYSSIQWCAILTASLACMLVSPAHGFLLPLSNVASLQLVAPPTSSLQSSYFFSAVQLSLQPVLIVRPGMAHQLPIIARITLWTIG